MMGYKPLSPIFHDGSIAGHLGAEFDNLARYLQRLERDVEALRVRPAAASPLMQAVRDEIEAVTAPDESGTVSDQPASTGLVTFRDAYGSLARGSDFYFVADGRVTAKVYPATRSLLVSLPTAVTLLTDSAGTRIEGDVQVLGGGGASVTADQAEQTLTVTAVGGSGTAGKLPKWDDATSLTDSLITEGTNSETVAGSLLPSANDSWDLGSSGARWQDLFLSGAATVGTLDGILQGTSGLVGTVTVDSPLTYSGGHLGLTLASVDHGGLGGLSDDDHEQYLLADGTRALTGDLSAGSHKITSLATPEDSADAATKGYVDSRAAGLTWKDPVLDLGENTPPGSPTLGDRHIVGSAPTGDWAGHALEFTYWNGSAWTFITPAANDACLVEAESAVYVFDGTSWLKLGGATAHDALTGLLDDDHTQYALLAGRAGGQSLTGGTVAGDDLTFATTGHATKGSYIFAEMTTAGFLKNSAAGVVTGGNALTKADVSDLPWDWTDVSKTGSSLADLETRSHSDLQGIGTDDHHAKAHSILGGDGQHTSDWGAAGTFLVSTGTAGEFRVLGSADLPAHTHDDRYGRLAVANAWASTQTVTGAASAEAVVVKPASGHNVGIYFDNISAAHQWGLIYAPITAGGRFSLYNTAFSSDTYYVEPATNILTVVTGLNVPGTLTNAEVQANTAARHTHPNKALLDTYDQTNADLTSAVALKHAAVTLGTANGLSLSGQQLSLGLSSSTTTGALSSADWSLFYSKAAGDHTHTGVYQPAGSYEVPLSFSDGLLRTVNAVTNVDKGTTARTAHEAAYDHALLHARQHSATSASDHAAAAVADYNKWLHSNATTGALEWKGIVVSDLPMSGTGTTGVAYSDHLHDDRYGRLAVANAWATTQTITAAADARALVLKAGSGNLGQYFANAAGTNKWALIYLPVTGSDSFALYNTAVSGNAWSVEAATNALRVHGVLKAGSTPTTVTSAAGKVLDAALEKPPLLADGTRAMAGSIDAAGHTFTNLSTPTLPSNPATKQYVDDLASGFVWLDPVLDKDLTAPPGSPTAGDRYIVGPSPTGAWAGHAGEVAEWGGSSWAFTVPDANNILKVADEGHLYVYDGANWQDLGSTTDHGALTGLSDDDHTQYHTDGRALTWLGTRSTSDLPEGAALYYTDARARVALSGTAPITYSSTTGAIGVSVGTTTGTVAAGDHAHADLQPAGDYESPLTFTDGLTRDGDTVSNSDKGSTARTAHEGDYDHTKIHDRAHSLTSTSDHSVSAAGDKGKFLRADASSGAPVWTALGGAALLDVGTAAGTVAAGDHNHDSRYGRLAVANTWATTQTVVSGTGGNAVILKAGAGLNDSLYFQASDGTSKWGLIYEPVTGGGRFGLYDAAFGNYAFTVSPTTNVLAATTGLTTPALTVNGLIYAGSGPIQVTGADGKVLTGALPMSGSGDSGVAWGNHAHSGTYEAPLTFSDGLTRTGDAVTNSDKGTAARTAHEGTYDHTKLHDAVALGFANGLGLAGQILSLQLASGTQPGALSAADWTTFNGKQPAGDYASRVHNHDGVYQPVGFYLYGSENLGDVPDKAAARVNLGLDGIYLRQNQYLGELRGHLSTVRNNLGLMNPVQVAGPSDAVKPALAYFAGDAYDGDLNWVGPTLRPAHLEDWTNVLVVTTVDGLRATRFSTTEAYTEKAFRLADDSTLTLRFAGNLCWIA